MNYREKMREFVKSPRDGSSIHYGKWCALNQEQTDYITRLLNEMDRADEYIKKLFLDRGKLQQENKQLQERIDNQKFLLKSQGKELKELYLIINKAIKYLEQPNRDNFDFSKANLLEILKGDSNE